MAENKPAFHTFRETENASDSSEESSEDENSVSESGSSNEGEYKLLEHETEEKSGPLEESSRKPDNNAKDDSVSESGSSDEGEYKLLEHETEENSDPLEESSRKHDNNVGGENSTPSEPMPSAVLDKEYIYMPQSFENFEERQEWKSSGKWLLYVQGDLNKLDHLWINLRPLLDDGTLICLKSSTATDRSKGGVIMCYTSDCDDRRAVKKAADAIRSILSDDVMLYYKTNAATDSGYYRAHGDNFITKYMHSVAGSLYERDEYNRWKKIFLESNDS